jgi:hypothetical protein
VSLRLYRVGFLDALHAADLASVVDRCRAVDKAPCIDTGTTVDALGSFDHFSRPD